MVTPRYKKKIKDIKEKIELILKEKVDDISDIKINILLSEKEAAEILGVREGNLRLLRFKKKGPPYYKIGGPVRYDYLELLQFLESVKRK